MNMLVLDSIFQSRNETIKTYLMYAGVINLSDFTLLIRVIKQISSHEYV